MLARIERSGMGVVKPAAGLRALHGLLANHYQSQPQVSVHLEVNLAVQIDAFDRH